MASHSLLPAVHVHRHAGLSAAVVHRHLPADHDHDSSSHHDDDSLIAAVLDEAIVASPAARMPAPMTLVARVRLARPTAVRIAEPPIFARLGRPLASALVPSRAPPSAQAFI